MLDIGKLRRGALVTLEFQGIDGIDHKDWCQNLQRSAERHAERLGDASKLSVRRMRDTLGPPCHSHPELMAECLP